MLEHDFEESLGCWIGAASREFERALSEELTPHGITPQQWQVLAWIAMCGHMTQTQLAQKMRVEAPTIVGILDRMERDGWICRCVSEADRRKKHIRPLERVQPIWETIRDAAIRVRERATRGIDPDDLARVRQVLNQVCENLKTPAETAEV